MIRHSVFYKLKHPVGSTGEASFFEKSKPLAHLPTVQNFQKLKQTSKKNNFAYGFAMDFADQAAYDAYNNHPVHTTYVNDIWIPNVDDFMEIDYEVI